MISTNDIIRNNIMNIMKQNNKKYDELADYLGISKIMIGKLLSGSRVINAMELKKIAEFLNVSKESLVKIPQIASETNTVNSLIGKAHSKEAKEGLAVADEIADMICFYARVYENSIEMMQPCE